MLFAVPPNNKCAGPLYEIVFMLGQWLRQHVRDRVNLVWTTYEQTFIQAFGPKLHEVVVEFASREIDGHGSNRCFGRHRRHCYEGGFERPFDLLISFPPYAAAFRSEQTFRPTGAAS